LRCAAIVAGLVALAVLTHGAAGQEADKITFESVTPSG
jgi:hypothetical protein